MLHHSHFLYYFIIPHHALLLPGLLLMPFVHWAFVVTDQGQGIPKDENKKILKVDYPRGRAKGYFANFISAKN